MALMNEVAMREDRLNSVGSMGSYESDDSVFAEKARIVVLGVDGSKTSEHAYDWFLKNLYRSGDKVVLVHAIDAPKDHIYPSVFVPNEVAKAGFYKECLRCQDIEDKYIKKMKESKIDGTYLSVDGKPGEVVCHTAEDYDAEVVVIGARAKGQIQRVIMGSVSDYIVNKCPVPVITIRKSCPL